MSDGLSDLEKPEDCRHGKLRGECLTCEALRGRQQQRERAEKAEAEAARLQAEAAALRKALSALRSVVLDHASWNDIVGPVGRALDAVRAALAPDAGKRLLAQVDAGKALAEEVRVMAWTGTDMPGAVDEPPERWYASIAYDLIGRAARALAAWDRAQEAGA